MSLGRITKLNTLFGSLAICSSLYLGSFLISGCSGSDSKKNNPPNIGDLPSLVTIEENKEFSLDIDVSDPDGDKVTLRIGYGLSNSFFRGSNGNTFVWTPGDSQVGKRTLAIIAEDGKGGVDSKSLDVDVVDDLSDSPKIQSTPTTKATEEGEFSYLIKASDPDTKDSLTFKLTQNSSSLAQSNATLSTIGVSAGSANLVWKDLPIGTHRIELEVEDSTKRKDIQSFDLVVEELLYALSGRVKDTSGNPIPNVTVNLGTNTTKFNVTDSNGMYKLDKISKGNYTISVGDSFSSIYSIRVNLAINKGDPQSITRDFVALRIANVSSTSTDYLDSAGNPDYLIFLKHISGTHPGSILYQVNQTTVIQRWGTLPVEIFLNENFNSSSADTKDPARDSLGFDQVNGVITTSPNGTNDLVDLFRNAIWIWETETGINLFEESQTPVGIDDVNYHGDGIFAKYPDLNGGGILSVGNPQNNRQYIEFQIANHLSDSTFMVNALHGLGRALGLGYDEGNNWYLMIPGVLSPTITKPHSDEVRALKIIYSLPLETDLGGFESK